MRDDSNIGESLFPILKSSALVSVKGRAYCITHRGTSQFVFDLNDSAECLVRAAKDCGSISEFAAAGARALDVPADIAMDLIEILGEDWAAAGALGPETPAFEAPGAPPRPPDTVPIFDQVVFIGCNPVRAMIHDPELAAVTAPMIRSSRFISLPEPGYALTAWRDGAIWRTRDSRKTAQAFDHIQDARDAILTDLVKNSRPKFSDAPAIHGATLRTGTGRHIMLSGDSGRGKTTLALGLAKCGFALLSDDICTFDAARNLLVPIMMNPSVKQGAWTPLAGLYPELAAQQPVDIKGRLCKYVTRTPVPGDDAPHGLDALIFPDWQPGAAAHLAPFDDRASLLSMLRWSYLPNDQASLQAMADFLSSVPLYQLTYSEFSDARDAILELLE